MSIVYPDPFLEVRVTCVDAPPFASALCAGYEGGAWRAQRLADHLFQWLPYAALNQEHQLAFGPNNFVEMLRLACPHIYKTRKTKDRGEIGELLLHLACILYFHTIPVMCKLILKTSPNDTVKGFDGIHLLPVDNRFEIWLGESKFYTNGSQAIRDAITSIREHVAPAFLNAEKAMVYGHVAPDIPHRAAVMQLFRTQTSGDELLRMSTFPILVAYESDSVVSFSALCQEYVAALTDEVHGLRQYFCDRADKLNLRFQLIFVPMERKAAVIESFDDKLEPFL